MPFGGVVVVTRRNLNRNNTKSRVSNAFRRGGRGDQKS